MNPLLRHLALPIELSLPSSRVVSISTCFHCFKLWQGDPLQDTYGGKAILDCNGEPLFAELAILRMLQASGWQGVWIDTYRRKFRQFLPPHSCDLPPHAQDFLSRAKAGQRWHSGCPDVLAWNDASYLFVEAKRSRKDSIRKTQLRWLESALTTLPLELFLVFEWAVST
jgi:hypothetical protein